MNSEDKAQIIIDLSTDAAIEALEFEKRKDNPRNITKGILFPAISRRVGMLMQCSEDTIYDEEAIPPPDDKFLNKYWKDIKILAASKHKKYIIPGTNGFRLGTLEEWCMITQERDMPIVKGIRKSGVRRWRIAKEQGGESPIIITSLRLPSGKKT